MKPVVPLEDKNSYHVDCDGDELNDTAIEATIAERRRLVLLE
jgi:hypothetical protein